MATLERQQAIRRILEDFRGLQSLKRLTSELNYNLVNKALSRRGWTDAAHNALADDPLLLATGGDDNEFKIIYAQLNSDTLLRGAERPVVTTLLQNHPYSLFVFSNRLQDRWHFVNVKHDEKRDKRRLFRRITIGEDERLRTASERIAMLDLEDINQTLFGIAPLEIQKRHDDAFNVETVTKQFFNEYKAIYGILQDDLSLQTKDKRWAHDYALQFLNRCMFIYFIQRKRWLGGDTDFLHTFWQSYRKSDEAEDSFFKRWLQVLFFEAFNNKKALLNSAQRKYLPENLRDALWRAPYLNGGLFSENKLDNTSHRFNITDARFEQIFTFLERYNFTITEDSPLDQEVAVDPEMIGKVYESLVNVSTEADERGDAGIFYTPRTEIDLMCRLALVDYLTNILGTPHKNLLYELVFALEPHEKQLSDTAVREAGLWQKIDERLREITVVDPACGSGSFLVGMLYVLDDLQCRAAGQLNTGESAYERKKRIIGQSLYGVDVMDWAAHVAELRMWLALIIDANFTQEELWQRNTPLLPHFTFKIRSGDSLVQEIGGLQLTNLRDLRAKGAPALKARITNLKNEKLKFYNNDPTCKFRSDRDLEQEELNLFRDLLDAHINQIQTEIRALQKQIDSPRAEQIDLLSGEVKKEAHQLSWQDVDRQKRIESLKEDLERVIEARAKLKTAKDVPFVWDIAFVEVFSDERGGFDVVLGNPPYVRQENIADPHLAREKVTVENKRAYKAKLQRAVYEAFPQFFGYNAKTGNARHKLDAKSDLYIYFYFLTLPLLNSKGAFCFITSNSWLDVGYGADLQEFLLKRCHVKLVIDNAAKRSFESADVNTVITLLSPPTEKTHADDATNPCLAQTTRFVMFKTGFENALSPVLFEEIEEANERRQTPEFRVFPINQRQLLADGIEAPDEEDEDVPTKGKVKRGKTGAPLVKVARYIGNKWGGKYLRAPDVYWTILDKGKSLTAALGDYFIGERYLNTGGADGFFIPTKVEKLSGGNYYIVNDNTTSKRDIPFDGEIEERFLEPLIKDYTKTNKKIEIQGYDAYCFVIREKPSVRLRKYIEWGEEQGYHLRSVTKSQNPWFKPTNQMTSSAKILVPRSFNNSFVIYSNPKAYLSLRFYRLHLKRGKLAQLVAYLNSTLIAFFLETLGNKTLGQGVLDFFMADFLAMQIPIVEGQELEEAYQKIKDRNIKSVEDEYGLSQNKDGLLVFRPLPDRKELDGIIFDALRLTKGEREAIYEAVIRLVEERLQKASSLKPQDRKERNKRRDAAESVRGIWQGIDDFEETEVEA